MVVGKTLKTTNVNIIVLIDWNVELMIAADEMSEEQPNSYNPSYCEHVYHADLSGHGDNMWLS